jgi:hypothetical protein
MNSGLPHVYLSYAWGGESERIVDALDADLERRGVRLVRDKRALGYKGSIDAFMQEIGRGHAVVVVISDKYLRSDKCMYELTQMARNADFRERIFPVVLRDADIFKPRNRLKYVEHWESEIKAFDEQLGRVGQHKLGGIREERDRYDDFRDAIGTLASMLADMNTLSPEQHEDSDFAAIAADIERRLKMLGAAGAPAPAAAPTPRAAVAAAVPGLAPAAAPAAANAALPVKVPGLRAAAEALLAPDAGDGTLFAIAVGETGEETVLLGVQRSGADLLLEMSDDLAGLRLAPAALAQVSAAPASRRLGRVGQIGADAVQAAVAAVVGGVFGLPDDDHTVRAIRLSAEQMQPQDEPVQAAVDEAGPEQAAGDDAEAAQQLDQCLAWLFGRLPKASHHIEVYAHDAKRAYLLLIVQRSPQDQIVIALGPPRELPAALRPSLETDRVLRKDWGFDLPPGEPDGNLVLLAGQRADLDRNAFGAALLDLVHAAYGFPRADFAFSVGRGEN